MLYQMKYRWNDTGWELPSGKLFTDEYEAYEYGKAEVQASQDSYIECLDKLGERVSFIMEYKVVRVK